VHDECGRCRGEGPPSVGTRCYADCTAEEKESKSLNVLTSPELDATEHHKAGAQDHQCFLVEETSEECTGRFK
jgi:hypothetical protein